MNKQQIFEYCTNHIKAIQDKYPQFKTPSITYFDRSRCAGKANYRTHTVMFNTEIAQANTGFENTITHELAHLLTKMLYPNAKQHHGPEFKRVHKMLGGTGETYHSFTVPNTAKRKVTYYKYKCGCKERLISSIQHNKWLNGTNYTCTVCNSRISPVMQADEFVKVCK